MRILLADGHGLVLDALSDALHRASPGAEVVKVESLDDALEKVARSAKFDVVLLDYLMPGMNGMGGLERAIKECGGAPVALISGAGSPELAEKARSVGASGFLSKTLGAGALASEILSLAAGERRFVSLAQASGMSGADLSRRERQVLSYLYLGMQNKEIARELDLQEVTVKLHVRSLCRKLDVANRTQAAMRGRELGVAPVL